MNRWAVKFWAVCVLMGAVTAAGSVAIATEGSTVLETFARIVLASLAVVIFGVLYVVADVYWKEASR